MKYYHVTIYNRGEVFTFQPTIPIYLRKGEDRRTPRICVTSNWKHSLRSIILIHRSQRYYIYYTEQQPVNPIEERQRRLQEKSIRKTSNDFVFLEDGFANKEHWFLQSTEMTREGMVVLPKEAYLKMLMGFGFMNEPDIDKLNLVPYEPEKDIFDYAEVDVGIQL
jgi:hypothetical protein